MSFFQLKRANASSTAFNFVCHPPMMGRLHKAINSLREILEHPTREQIENILQLTFVIKESLFAEGHAIVYFLD